MTELIARLDELTQRASKISDGQSQEAASLLLPLYSETGDKVRTADFLMKFKATVCLCFFERAVAAIEPERIESLHMAICATESYKRNANHASTTRGFIIAAVLIKYGQNIARAVLMRTLADVEKDGKFSDTVIEHFKRNVVDYCGLDAITKLNEREWKKPEIRNRFNRFMQAANESMVTVISTPTNDSKTIVEVSTNTPIATVTSQERPTVECEPKAAAPVAGTPPTVLKADDKSTTLTAELLKILESSNREAQKLLQTLNESNGTIAILRGQVSDRDAHITGLAVELHERDRQIDGLQSKVDKEKCLCDEQQSKIADLTERLKTSMQMDSISQNQELVTLKSDLANSLKLEYADYLNDKDSECNPDTFGAFRSSLTRIFKTLRRFGIMID